MSDFGSRFSASASSLVMKPTSFKLRQRRRRDARAGGDDEMFCGELGRDALPRVLADQQVGPTEFHRVRIQKSCVGADEFEFSGVELLDAKIGKILDQRIFPRHHLFEIKADFSSADAPRFRMFGQMLHFRCVKQGFGRHAAAQDAKSADLLAAFDDDRFQPCARCRPRRRIAAAAAADDGHVEIKSFHAGEDGSASGNANLTYPWLIFLRVEE